MNNRYLARALATGLTLAALVAPTLADFSGQTILGPLTNGSSIDGTLVGATDDNDGWFSGGPVFGIWDGGDNVYALNWTGGDMTVTLTYDNLLGDPDLFLYTPGNLDESSFDSITFFTDSVNVPAAAAGTWYVLVDAAAGSEGPYNLSITPEPTSLALLGIVALLIRRR